MSNTTPSKFFISQVTPYRGTKEGDTIVFIGGSGFTGVTEVRFNNVVAPKFIINSDTEIAAVTPPSSTIGYVDVTVHKGSEFRVLNKGFLYRDIPAGVGHGSLDPLDLFSINPSEGSISGGNLVTLYGTGLDFATNVAFDGILSPNVQHISSTEIVAVTPPHAPGYVNVTVYRGGISSTLFNIFHYLLIIGLINDGLLPRLDLLSYFGDFSDLIDPVQDLINPLAITPQNLFIIQALLPKLDLSAFEAIFSDVIGPQDIVNPLSISSQDLALESSILPSFSFPGVTLSFGILPVFVNPVTINPQDFITSDSALPSQNLSPFESLLSNPSTPPPPPAPNQVFIASDSALPDLSYILNALSFGNVIGDDILGPITVNSQNSIPGISNLPDLSLSLIEASFADIIDINNDLMNQGNIAVQDLVIGDSNLASVALPVYIVGTGEILNSGDIIEFIPVNNQQFVSEVAILPN